MEAAGFVVITGDVGIGKTTLLNALLEELDPNIKTLHLSDPGSTTQDLFYLIKQSLDLPVENISKGEILWALNDFMRDELSKDERVLLIIDEAQRLSADMLEEIRLLSNIETPEKRLFQIFLVGQQELNAKLKARELRQLRQRIGVKYHLRPLSDVEDTHEYIMHRLQVAGLRARPYRGQELFSPAVIKAIHKFSKGYPRVINIICENALVTAYAKEASIVTTKIVNEVIRDMEASYETGQKRVPRRLAWITVPILLLVAIAYGLYRNPGIFQMYLQSDARREPPASSGTATPEVEHIKDISTDSQDAVSGTEAPPEMPPAEKALKDVVQSRSEDTMHKIHEEVFFGFDSYRIQPDAYDTLKRMAEVIQRFPEAQILIEGHSDNVGDERANQVMSERRAEAVRQWLMDHTGAEASRFTVKGWGPTRPKFSNDSPEGRRKNRRVDISFQVRERIDTTSSAEPVLSHPKNSKQVTTGDNL